MAFVFAYSYLAANTPRLEDERELRKFEDHHLHNDRLLGEDDALILAHNKNNNNNPPLAKPNVASKKSVLSGDDDKTNEDEDNNSVLEEEDKKNVNSGPHRPPSGPVPLLTSVDFKRAASKQSAMQKRIQAAIVNSWAAYRRSAWGYDHLKPISKTGHNWFHIGLTILDSLDTLQMAGLEKGKLIFNF